MLLRMQYIALTLCVNFSQECIHTHSFLAALSVAAIRLPPAVSSSKSAWDVIRRFLRLLGHISDFACVQPLA